VAGLPENTLTAALRRRGASVAGSLKPATALG
jgi:hypothetical protein